MVDDCSIPENHGWWIFYTRRSLLKNLVYGKIMVDDFFSNERIDGDGISERENHAWRLFYSNRLLLKIFVNGKNMVDDFSLPKY